MGTNISEDNRSPGFENEKKVAHQESLGIWLRKERLKKGLNLQEIADGTCIHIATLRALEEDDDSRMPAEVFTRGFLRLYAEYIGIDPGDILKRYDRTKQELSQNVTDDQAASSKRKSSCRFFSIVFRRKFFAVLVLLGLVALGLLFYYASLPVLK
ncbi:MAG: helix-turn-helix domain-containing protein [Thermodesulfobacteriota bacterium]